MALKTEILYEPIIGLSFIQLKYTGQQVGCPGFTTSLKQVILHLVHCPPGHCNILKTFHDIYLLPGKKDTETMCSASILEIEAEQIV